MKCPSCQKEYDYPPNTCTDCGFSLKQSKKDYLADCLSKVEENPDDPIALSMLGWGYFINGKKKQAFDILDKAIRLNKKIPDLYPYVVLSDMYEFSDKYEKSYQVLANGLVEKLDQFRGSEDINGFETVDSALRQRYLEFRVWAYNRIQTKTGDAARRGSDQGARKLGYSSSFAMDEAKTNAAGTYELAKRLSKKERIPSNIRKLLNLFILATIALTIVISLLSNDFSIGCPSGIVLSALVVGFYGFSGAIIKFLKDRIN